MFFFLLRRSLFSFSYYHLLMESYVKNGKKKNGGKRHNTVKHFLPCLKQMSVNVRGTNNKRKYDKLT